MINNIVSEFRWLLYVSLGLFMYRWCIGYLKNRHVNLYNTLEVKDHGDFVRSASLLLSGLLMFLVISKLLLGFTVPYAQFLLPLVALIAPVPIFKEERIGLLECMYRLAFPKRSAPIPAHQVIIADVLTSYAKILADWDVLFFCSLLHRFQSNSQQCAPSILGVLLVCIPYVVRIRQCWHDWSIRKEGRGWAFLNIIKYATSFPVLYLSYIWLYNPQGKRIWIMANLVNYLYSSAWDVFMDWQLRALFSNLTMREYAAVMVDLIIRGLWMTRLVTNASIDSVTSLLEVGRRFMWLVLRIEALDRQQSSKSPLLSTRT